MGIFSFLKRKQQVSHPANKLRSTFVTQPAISRPRVAPRSNAAETVVDARRERLRQERVQDLKNFWQRNFKFFVFPLFFMAASLVAWGVSIWLNSTNYLEVKRIQVVGNQQLTVEQVQQVLQSYIGQSMIGLSSSEIEDKVRENFAFVQNAYVRKLLPDALEVELDERFPEYVYVNLAGAYLIDTEGVVIRRIAYTPRPDLSEEERAIVDGYLDLDSERIKERYFTAWVAAQTEANKDNPAFKLSRVERPKWEEVPAAEKQAVAAQLQQEFVVLLNDSFKAYDSDISDLNLPDITRFRAISNEDWQEGDIFVDTKVHFYRLAKLYVQQNERTLADITWRNDYHIRLKLASGVEIVFTSIKPLEDQFRALESVSKVEKITRLREIDLRGDLVAVFPK